MSTHTVDGQKAGKAWTTNTVSRLGGALNEKVRAFRERPLNTHCPYAWLNTTFPRVRAGGRYGYVALRAGLRRQRNWHDGNCDTIVGA